MRRNNNPANNVAVRVRIMTELRFYIPLATKKVISEMLFPANCLASIEKTKIKNQKKQ